MAVRVVTSKSSRYATPCAGGEEESDLVSLGADEWRELSADLIGLPLRVQEFHADTCLTYYTQLA